MSEDGKKRPFAASFMNLALSLFFGVILLVLAVEMAKKIWWLLLLIAIGAATLTVLRYVYERKKRWDQ